MDKWRLARRLTTSLPAMTLAEAIETTRIVVFEPLDVLASAKTTRTTRNGHVDRLIIIEHCTRRLIASSLQVRSRMWRGVRRVPNIL
jgi:hypothetical protein